ncbi:ribonuclease TUDOR 1-like protein [Tanacetum coccineum]
MYLTHKSNQKGGLTGINQIKGGDTGCVSQPDWPAVIVINHYQASQITAGQSGCDTQPDVPTLTCAPGAHVVEVVSGDCIIIADDALSFGSPAAQVSMEYSRKVHVADGSSAQAGSADSRQPTQPARLNIVELIIARGFGTVIRHREFEEHSNHYENLLAAESCATTRRKGIHSAKDPPSMHVTDLFHWLSVAVTKKAKSFPPFSPARKRKMICCLKILFHSGHEYGSVVMSLNSNDANSLLLEMQRIVGPSATVARISGGAYRAGALLLFFTNMASFILLSKVDTTKYIIYDRVMLPLGALTAHKLRNDIGVKRGRHSTSFSSAFHYGSSSRPDDDDVDMHDEGTFRQNIPSPTTYYHSLSPLVPETFVNLLENDQKMSTMFNRQTSMLNRQRSMHMEQRGALKSTGKEFRKIFKKK